jgi:signal transduction histidine kinase/HAMP domain-containing protein
MARMNPVLAQPQEPAPPSRTLSLRTREILAVTVLTLCVIVLTTVMHLYHTRRIVLAATRTQAEFVTRQIYSQSAHALSRPSGGMDPRTVLARDTELRALLDASVGYDPALLYALIADENGVAIVHTDRKQEGQRVLPQPRFGDASPARSGLTLAPEPQIYEVALPFDVAGKPFATIRLGIAVPLIRSQLNDVFWQALTLGAVALAGALLVALALSTVSLQPIRKLAEDMERLRRGEFDVGSSAGPKDEFGKLAYQLQLLGKQIQSDRTRLLTERTQIQTAVDHLEDGIMFFGADGRILFANRAGEAALGRPAPNVAGASLDDLLGADHPLRPILRRALEEGAATRNVTVEVRTETGAVELLASVFPIAEAGAACEGAIVVTRDLKSVSVSARTFQSLIQYSAQLAALGQLTSEVTHDIKNPLHAMMVHIAFLKERLPNRPADIARSLDIIEAEIKRADQVLNRFLEAVRPSELPLRPISLNVLLREIASLLQTEWHPKGIVFAVTLDEGLPQVPGDEELLRRAFMNLIVNACQAMPEGGLVTITSATDEGGVIKATVTDTGTGIPPENLERIFKMYYTTKTDGTGIGLPLVRRVVELHRGSVEFLSTVGRGTTVIVRLPLEESS